MRHAGDLLGIACAVAVLLGLVPGLEGRVAGAVALLVLIVSAARIAMRLRA